MPIWPSFPSRVSNALPICVQDGKLVETPVCSSAAVPLIQVTQHGATFHDKLGDPNYFFALEPKWGCWFPASNLSKAAHCVAVLPRAGCLASLCFGLSLCKEQRAGLAPVKTFFTLGVGR